MSEVFRARPLIAGDGLRPAVTSAESAARMLAEADGLADTQPQSALRLLDSLTGTLLRRDHPELTARVNYLRGRLHSLGGNYPAALDSIRSARRDWLAAGLPLEALRSELGRTTVLIELGEFTQAVEVNRKLLRRLDALLANGVDGTDPHKVMMVRAGAYNNLGNALNLMGDHYAAMREYDLASNLFHALGDHARQAEMDANRAIASLRIGTVHRAVDDLRRAAKTLRELGRVLPAAKCTIDLAEAHLLLDEPVVALTHLEGVVGDLEEIDAYPEIARLRLTLASALLQCGLYADAFDQASCAAAIFTDLTMDAEAARGYYVSGWASLELGSAATAASYLDLANRLYTAVEDAVGQASVWLLKGRILAEEEGNSIAALELTRQAIDRLGDGTAGSFEAARAHLQVVRYSEDADEIEGHLAIASDLIERFNIQRLRGVREKGRARLLRVRGDLWGAARVLSDAMDVERRRLETSGRSRVNVGTGDVLQRTADALLEVLIEIGTDKTVTQAWLATNMVRAEWVRQELGVDPSPSNWWERQLTLLSHMYDDLADIPGDRRERGTMQGMVTQHQRMLVRRGLTDREVVCGNRPVTETPPIPEVPLLQFHVLGPDIAAFVVRDGAVSVRVLRGANSKIRTLIGDWQVECARMQSRRDPDELDTAAQLMGSFDEVLIAPVVDLLEDLDDEPLMVILHQHLFDAPFEAFEADGVPLSQRFSLYFCSSLARDGEETGAATAGTLVVGAPDLAAPAIEQEVTAVARTVPTATTLLGDEASTTNLRELSPGRDVVHIACHGTFHAENPLFSALRLSDRWLTGAEIMGYDLAGAMVVIGACDAGRGAADGAPVGLTWAFLAAGARSVVAPKWAADDEACRALMTSLHRHLADGLPARVALDRARVEVRQVFPHPYYWAVLRYVCSPTSALQEEVTP